MPHSFRGAP